jgi:hypothetical protein
LAGSVITEATLAVADDAGDNVEELNRGDMIYNVKNWNIVKERAEEPRGSSKDWRSGGSFQVAPTVTHGGRFCSKIAIESQERML